MGDELVKHDRAVPVILSHGQDYEAWLARLPADKKKRVLTSNQSMRTGLHTVAPLTCCGPARCKYIAHCPLAGRDEHGNIVAGDAEDYPVGRPCVMEALYMRAKIEEYYAHLQVDVHNPVEVALVNELALIDLYKNRALMVLSAGDSAGQGQDLMRTDVIGITEQGHELQTTQTHPAFEALERLENRRGRLLDKLVETRQAKVNAQAKLGKHDEASQVLQELQAVKRLLLDTGETSKEIELKLE